MAKKDKALDLSGNPNLIDLLREARRLGCEVSINNRSGEVRVACVVGRVNCNSRRKDGNRSLIVLLRRMQGQQGGTL